MRVSPNVRDASSGIDVSILVVSFNTRELTLAALRSAVAQTLTVSYEIIVVDNASEDGSAEAIRSEFPGIQMIALSRNVGFAPANNLASAQARGRYLLLLNPDTVVLDGAIDRLVSFAESDREAGIWGGRTLFADRSLNPSSCWRRITLWNLFCRASGLTGIFQNSEVFNSEAFGGWKRDTVRRVDLVSGCFLLIDHALWKRLGGFAPQFYMYGEEADLCLRAHALGAKPCITPAATIVHLGGASERTRLGKMVKLLAAKALLIERHFGPVSRHAGFALLAGWPLSRWLVLAGLGYVTGSKDAKQSAQVWREVWTARSEWLRVQNAQPVRVSQSRTPPLGLSAEAR